MPLSEEDRMNGRVLRLALTGALLLPTLAQALDKEEKQWLEDMKPLVLGSEEKAFNSLKSKEDRAEFQKIFWARRDPDLLTPENEWKPIFEERRAAAIKNYTMKEADRDAGIFLPVPGNESDCGLVYIILGEPTSKQKSESNDKGKVSGMPARWVYSGNVKGDFSFDGNCRFPPAGSDQLRERLRQSRVVQSDVDYHIEKGKLTKPLADMLPKPGPAQALLLQPRQDFPLAHQVAFVKIQEGGTGLFGLVQGDAAGLTVQDVKGKKKAPILLRAEAKGEGVNILSEREVLADVSPDGKFVASYRLGLRPGTYDLKVGAIDTASNKGSVFAQNLEVPDYNKGELTIASLFTLEDIQEGTPDPKDAFAAFEIGTTRLVPRFGNVFKQADSLQISYQFYDPKIDEATKKGSAIARLSILKSTGGVTAEAPEQSFEGPVAGSAVGPVSLAKYVPGKYRIQLKVTDNIAMKTYTQETTFEVAK
jgi:GWxTD domain-containing protein